MENQEAMEPTKPPLLRVRGLSKHFSVEGGLLRRSKKVVRAVDGVDLDVEAGELVALVGESGSGKTTLGRCIIRLVEPTAGSILFDGEELMDLKGKELRQRRRRFQMVFQDPYGSLNPRMRVRTILAEPLQVHGLVSRAGRREKVAELLTMVGLDPSVMDRFPHEFSGGQRQRIGIARALATEPDFLVADEPVSALDVSVRAQVVNLLMELKESLGLTVLFIAHDIALVEQIADRVVVLYHGRVAEIAPARSLAKEAKHPYTVSLLSAVPVPVPGREHSRIVLEGDPPSRLEPVSGCPFHPRCPIARPRCATETPVLRTFPGGGMAACHYPGELGVDAERSKDGTFHPQTRSDE